MTKNRGFWHGLIFIMLALLLAVSMLVAACGGGGGEKETPTPTRTATPTTIAPTPTVAPTTATPTPTAAPTTPAPTGTPGGAMTTVPAMPSGWQALPQDLQDTYGVSYYFPGEWITMTTQPLPTVILALDPTFFPNSELRMFDVPAGTTNAQYRDIIINKYPSENGGEYDNFQVLEQGDVTLDCGLTVPYMIHQGTRMGYGAKAYDVFLVKGTQGFILTCGDYPVTFDDSKDLLVQIAKTLYPTTPMPIPGAATPTPAPTATAAPTATPTAAPTTTVPVMPSGWQGMPQDLQTQFKINYYFPGEWITMTTQPLPTVILALDPTFFPNSELREFDVPAGTTNAQYRDIIINKYPSENGGEYDNFQVLEQGDVTLDSGVQTVYMIHQGTRMGYGARAYDVFLVRGTQGFILTCGDYPVTFDDSKDLLVQIAKTLYLE
jgi:hypothetical protein